MSVPFGYHQLVVSMGHLKAWKQVLGFLTWRHYHSNVHSQQAAVKMPYQAYLPIKQNQLLVWLASLVFPIASLVLPIASLVLPDLETAKTHNRGTSDCRITISRRSSTTLKILLTLFSNLKQRPTSNKSPKLHHDSDQHPKILGHPAKSYHTSFVP